MKKIGWIFCFVMTCCDGSVDDHGDSSADVGESVPSCGLDRGTALPENLMGDFILEEILTYEEDELTSGESMTDDRTVRLMLRNEENMTDAEVENTWTTDEASTATVQITLEGDSQLAVLVEESNIPYVVAGAIYCLGFIQGEDSFTSILNITSQKSFHLVFIKGGY